MTNNDKQRTMNYLKQTQTKPICSEPIEVVEPMDYTVDETKKSV